MNIYFSGSIRGGRNDANLYKKIIDYLKTFGTVLTEHIGDTSLTSNGQADQTDEAIHNQDMKFLNEANIVIAEVTNPSLGVGYEIGRAIEYNKRTICLFNNNSKNKLSAMIAGSKKIKCIYYDNYNDLINKLKICLKEY